MLMSQLTDLEMAALNHIAHEITEVFSSRGHTVTVSLDSDHAYRDTNIVRAGMVKALVMDGIQKGAADRHMGWETGAGGCREIHSTSGSSYKLFRLRKADVTEGGGVALLGDETILTGLEPPSLTFGAQERWLFSYTVEGDAPGRFFVAQVLGVTETSPSYLELGPITWLDPNAPIFSKRFTPVDESLPGFDDAEDDSLEDEA